VLPHLAVIVPVHNGKAHLDNTLGALKGAQGKYQSKGGLAQIVVVDDSSTDSSVEIARRYADKIVELKGPAVGPAVARNRGAQATGAEILVFVDADVLVKPDTLTKIGEFFEGRADYDAVFGSYDDDPGDPGLVSQYKNLFHHFVHQSSQEESSSFWAGCGAIKAEAFRSVGGFPEKYPEPAIEDIELGYTLISMGYRSYLLKDLQVKHLKKWTLFNLIKTDIFMRGIPWTRLLFSTRSFTRDLNLQTHNRISVVLVYLMVLSAVGSFKWPWLLASILPLGGFFIFLNFGLYLFFAEKKGFGFVLWVIPLHVLYYFYNGISFIIGLLLHISTQGKGQR